MGYGEKSRRRPLWYIGSSPWFLYLCLSTCLSSFTPLWPSSWAFYYTLWPSCKFPWINLHSWCWHVHIYEVFLSTIEELLGLSAGWVNESQDGSQHNTIQLKHMQKGQGFNHMAMAVNLIFFILLTTHLGDLLLKWIGLNNLEWFYGCRVGNVNITCYSFHIAYIHTYTHEFWVCWSISQNF